MTDALDQRGLERSLLGGQRRYTRLEVAAEAGVEQDRAQRLWLALGFASVGDDEVAFTDADVEALRMIDGLVRAGVVERSAELSLARALGQTLSRLAEWETRGVRELEAVTADPEHAVEVVTELLPVVERMHSYVWRRHLAAAAGRVLAAPDESLDTQHLVVGFADIVGFTSRSRQMGADELAGYIEAFEEDAAQSVASAGGRVVKTVGDEVLFVTDHAADAAAIALELTSEQRAGRGLPELRVGMAAGQVLSRFGDVYGSVVNLAARLTSVARPGTVLVDKELHEALRSDERFLLRSRRPTSVRGYRHLKSWALRPR